MPTTPPPHTTTVPVTSDHPPPSLPSSPLAKRARLNPMALDDPNAPSSTSNPVIPPVTAEPALRVKFLSDKAKAPTRGSAFAAGYDLYAAEACSIPARGKALVGTNLAIVVPGGCYGRVAPRSGLAVKNFIDTGAGVIDSDYRGEVKVLLFNFSQTDFAVNVGDRIAQLVLERIYTPEVMVVEELEESVRGAGGFGSTG